MHGVIASLWRYPLKGFTPERRQSATLSQGAHFPCDRLFAVEDGPSGFDAERPSWISKTRFAVLAKAPGVARVKTAFDEQSCVLSAYAEGHGPFSGALNGLGGREGLSAWLKQVLGDEVNGPLRVIDGQGHSFTDHPNGYVSMVNLSSVRDIELRTGKRIDPLRFRANIYIDGWEAWVEDTCVGSELRVGDSTVKIFSLIKRCSATHVDPLKGVRDFELLSALYDNYNHLNCGIYVSVLGGGNIEEGDFVGSD